jgi:hypothetical protein
MGSAPTEFDGDRAKADQFMNELRHYFCINATIPRLQSWIRRVAIALTFIKGPTVDEWALNQGDWVDRLDPLIEDVPDVWTNFLNQFRNQFQCKYPFCAVRGTEQILCFGLPRSRDRIPQIRRVQPPTPPHQSPFVPRFPHFFLFSPTMNPLHYIFFLAFSIVSQGSP